MKKYLSLLMIPVISLFMSMEVNAEELYLEYDEDFSLIQEKISSIGYDVFNSGVDSAINYYKENYFNDFPYYSISIDINYDRFNDDEIHISLYVYNDSSFTYHHDFFSESSEHIVYHLPYPKTGFYFSYDSTLNSFILDSSVPSGLSLYPIFNFLSLNNFIYPYNYYYSNFDYYYYGTSLGYFISAYDVSTEFLSIDDTLYIPLYDNPTTYSVYHSTEDFLIQPYYLYDENSTLEPDSDVYTTINLNDFSYIALSLKNYDVESFDTTFYVKGQLCPTKVYGYGLTETNNTDRCNPAYQDFTPVRIYTSDYDINNHFIYYFKAYDKSIDNVVKVNSSVFNIHYITEDEKDNPILDINGHKYSAIPFDSLSSSANKNETDNFVPGAVEKVTIESFFDKPLELLESVWGAIQSIFTIITEFILLLPPVMQGFLFTAFGISIVLGIIKILL